MTREWAYKDKDDHNPALPVLEALVLQPWSAGVSEILTLEIDSGSAMTGIPVFSCRRLGLRKVAEEKVAGFNGKLTCVPIYLADIEIMDRNFPKVEVAGLTSRVGIVGRDLLNSFVCVLDGPRGRTYLTLEQLLR